MITYEYINPNDYVISYDSAVPEAIFREKIAKNLDKQKQDASDVNRLLSQLTAAPRVIDIGTIISMTMSSFLLVARDEAGHIQGMATLCVSLTLTGNIGLVEDVVVDVSLRGQHVGEGLMERLIRYAKESRVDRLELTSKPERIAANKLYQKLGFKLRETNNYTLVP